MATLRYCAEWQFVYLKNCQPTEKAYARKLVFTDNTLVILIFQPGEERGNGARDVISDPRWKSELKPGMM